MFRFMPDDIIHPFYSLVGTTVFFIVSFNEIMSKKLIQYHECINWNQAQKSTSFEECEEYRNTHRNILLVEVALFILTIASLLHHNKDRILRQCAHVFRNAQMDRATATNEHVS